MCSLRYVCRYAPHIFGPVDLLAFRLNHPSVNMNKRQGDISSSVTDALTPTWAEHCCLHYRGTGRSTPESICPGSICPTSAPSAVVPPQVYGRYAPGPGSFRPNRIVVRVHLCVLCIAYVTLRCYILQSSHILISCLHFRIFILACSDPLQQCH